MNSLRSILPTALALTAIAAGFILLVHRPAIARNAELRREIEDAATAAEALPVRLAELSRLNREIEDRREFLAGGQQPLVSDAAATGLIHRIGAIAARNRLFAVRVEPLPSETAETYEERPYRVTFDGRGDRAIAFIAELERPPSRVEFRDLTLTRDDRGGGASGDVRGVATFVVYVGEAVENGVDGEDRTVEPLAVAVPAKQEGTLR